jgi:hypothetical protein
MIWRGRASLVLPVRTDDDRHVVEATRNADHLKTATEGDAQ